MKIFKVDNVTNRDEGYSPLRMDKLKDEFESFMAKRNFYNSQQLNMILNSNNSNSKSHYQDNQEKEDKDSSSSDDYEK